MKREDLIRMIIALLKKAGKRELELIYEFSSSLTN